MTLFEERIQHYMDAGFPILYLNTFEECKALEAVKRAAGSVNKMEILEWDGTDRICEVCTGAVKYDMSMYTLANVLDDRLSYTGPQVLVLKNIDTFMDDPSVMARLSKLAVQIHSGELEATVVIISPVLKIPQELEKYIVVVEMDYLTTEEIDEIVRRFIQEQGIIVSDKFCEKLVNALKGMTEFEIENVLNLACAMKHELTNTEIGLIFDQKQQMIKKAGILEMIQQKEAITDIGGLENLKSWLNRKKKVFSNLDEARKFGVDMPKGVLIAGIPGCGKSLSAKATASLFELPLLRLDMGRLLGKYVGESEANMRKAIRLAEATSPCVLWIDELEKAFAGIGGDGSGAEVTTRLFGSFLTWLQEKESPVFVVATANDITKLPPELLRKGRFDEIFYVGLPQKEERRKIFEIHIKKRREQDLPSIQQRMDELLRKTEGYSGADIEGVVRESVELAYANDKGRLTADDVIQAINNTHSLSEILEEPIKKMTKEYETRKFKNASA